MPPIIAMPKLGIGFIRAYMGIQYVLALKAAGARVRWVDTPEAALECDGLLIPGGDDIAPALYGQEPSPLCGKPNKLRDRLDPWILGAFVPTGKPVLGICRGIQMMNVFLGGTLHQDIKHLQKLNHSQMKLLKKPCHDVTVEENSRLHQILGKKTIAVNTVHHQALDRLAEALVVTALSSDGIVEAVELPEHPFFVGVQWHPENLRQCEDHQKLFRAFVDACK